MRIFVLCNELVKKAESYQHENLSGMKDRLEKLGLTSSTNYRKILEKEDFEKKVEIINFYKENFPNSLLMKRDDFKSLINEYRLSCGAIEQYIGEVPDKNLKEIEIAIDTISRINIDNDYSPNRGVRLIRKLYYTSNVEEYYEFQSFPFLGIGENKYIRSIPEDDSYFFRDKEYVVSRLLRKDSMLIAATGDKINSIKFEKNILKPLVENDPIVFQFLPMDLVIIHSKWGAEEEAIRNYKRKLL